MDKIINFVTYSLSWFLKIFKTFNDIIKENALEINKYEKKGIISFLEAGALKLCGTDADTKRQEGRGKIFVYLNWISMCKSINSSVSQPFFPYHTHYGTL